MMQELALSSTSFFAFGIKEKLAHLWSALAKCLAGLFPGSRISNLVPEIVSVVLLEELAAGLTNGPDNGFRNGWLVILAGLEVRTAMEVDQVTKVTVSGMYICATSSATEDIVVFKVDLPLFAGSDRRRSGGLIGGIKLELKIDRGRGSYGRGACIRGQPLFLAGGGRGGGSKVILLLKELSLVFGKREIWQRPGIELTVVADKTVVVIDE